MWWDYYSTEYATYNDLIIFKILHNGRDLFTIPVGPGSASDGLEAIRLYADFNNIPLGFTSVTLEGLNILKGYFGGNFIYESSRDLCDYLYSKEELVSLAGRKYAGQRNHINRFKKLYGECIYKPITNYDIDKILKCFDKYLYMSKDKIDLFEIENMKAKEVLEKYPELNLLGGFVEVNDEVVAFSIGEIVNDVLFVHVEKALIEYHGAYSVINQEFAKNNNTEEVLYIN